MKKYFIKGTDKEVQMGERVNICNTEDDENSTTHVMVNSILTEETLDYLLDLDIIEVRGEEEEEEEDDYECCEFAEVIDHLSEVTASLVEKVSRLESSLNALKSTISTIVKSM